MALQDSFVKKTFTPIEEQDALQQERARAYLEEAGLEGASVDYLRKSQLSVADALDARKEQLDYARQKKSQKNDWDEFVDAKRRMGRVLYHSEFIRKLRSIFHSKLIVSRAAVNGQISLYVVRNTSVKEFLELKTSEEKSQFLFKDRSHFDCPWYAGWIDQGWMPEFEIDTVNDAGVAIGQKRGWRTALLRMQTRYRPTPSGEVPDAFVSESAVQKEFGFPTNGITGSWYRQGLFDFRNGIKHTNPNVAYT